MKRTRWLAATVMTMALGAGPALAARMAPEFARQAAQGVVAEVPMSRLAADRASDPEVRDFAQRMVTDHARANDQLERIAQDRGWMLPQRPDVEHRAMLRRLRRRSGDDFDRAYMRAMVADHDATVMHFRRYARNGDDPRLRTWARRTLPTLVEHRHLARQTREGV